MSEVSSLGKDLTGLENLSAEQILMILDTAEPFKEISERRIKKVPVLRGKTIFIEDDARSWATEERRTQGAWRTVEECRAGLMRNLAIGASRALRIALPADRLRVFTG